MAINRQKQLYGWGDGNQGCLGVGETRKKTVPIALRFFEGKTIIDVGCGDNFTVVIAEVVGDPMERTGSTVNLLAGCKFLDSGSRYDAVQVKEIPVEKVVKSIRKPLWGGEEISIGSREKVMSVIRSNRLKSISQLESVNEA